MFGIMIGCMDVFLLSTFEGRKLGYFVGYFDRTGDDVDGTCVGLGVGGIMRNSDIDAMRLNDSSHIFCKSEM